MTQEQQHNGWRSFAGPPLATGVDGLHVHGYVRDDGRPVITDVYIHSAAGITNEDWRDVSLSRIEAQLAADGDLPSGDETPGDERAPSVDELRGAASEITLGELRRTLRQAKRRRVKARPTLQRPDGTDTDGFYRLVGRAYLQYAAETSAPAKSIAEEADVPVTTAHRWVREARRRGHLPPARKGKAG